MIGRSENTQNSGRIRFFDPFGGGNGRGSGNNSGNRRNNGGNNGNNGNGNNGDGNGSGNGSGQPRQNLFMILIVTVAVTVLVAGLDAVRSVRNRGGVSEAEESAGQIQPKQGTAGRGHAGRYP